MAFYRTSPDNAPMYVRYFGNGHHFKDKRPNVEDRPGALWEIEGPHPGMEHFEASLRQRLGDKADRALDLASSEPVNINVFPNLHILGNHIQVSTPVAVDETDTTWYGTAVVDEDGVLEGTVDAINALRMRTQESFPNFGEIDDLANFEQIQVGFQARRTNGSTCIAGSASRPLRDRRRRGDYRPADGRGVHARAHEGVEAPDDGRPAHRDHPGGVSARR